VSADARLTPPVLVGARCDIEAGAVVGPASVLGDGSHVGAGARVERGVLLEGARIGPEAVVSDSVVGSDARVGAGSRLERGVVVGAGAQIEDNAGLADGERVDARPFASETS
jgi:mannose-1-phosphate guanylyltransferase